MRHSTIPLLAVLLPLTAGPECAGAGAPKNGAAGACLPGSAEMYDLLATLTRRHPKPLVVISDSLGRVVPAPRARHRLTTAYGG